MVGKEKKSETKNHVDAVAVYFGYFQVSKITMTIVPVYLIEVMAMPC